MERLRVENLWAGYGGRRVIEDLDLSLQAGQRVALIGPNGCGKSTLLRAIAGDGVQCGGRIMFDRRSLAGWPAERIASNGIGYLRQARNIFPGLSIADNMSLAARVNGGNGDLTGMQSLAAFAPELVSRAGTIAGLLSGGLRQALALSMVLARPLKLLLLDEPIAGLSPEAAQFVLNQVQRLQAERGFTVLIVEHRLRLVQPFVDRVVVMSRGKVVENDGDVGLLTDPARLAVLHML